MATTTTEADLAPLDDEARVRALARRLVSRLPPSTTPPAEFLAAQFDAGLAWVHYPSGCGGLGLERRLGSAVSEELASAGAPSAMAANPIGYGMAAPTIIEHGSPEQVRRYMRRIFTGEDVWCQLFSEPGAGSDLASLATRAVRDGDEWSVSGQKVWTTLAHRSKYGLLLARTDPHAEKHRGLTYFVVDMCADGVEVRPLRQMTGDAEFNEVYLDQVRIPDSERLGGVGEGWKVAITTLMNERVSIGSAEGPRGSGAIATALGIWGARAPADPVARDRLLRLWVESELHRLTALRAALNSHNGTPGPEGSTLKLHYAELNKRIYECCVDMLGPEGMIYDSYDMRQPDSVGGAGGIPARMFLRSRANSIEGGTSEIMRNILAERVLGLPGDLRADKGLPWDELRRS